LADVRFADFILPIVRRRSLVFGITGVAVVAAVVIALVWPQSWRANATVLPPERRMDNPLFVPGGFEALGASLRGVTLRHVATPTDIFVAILESRSVRDSLVQRFSLRDVYGVETDAAAIKQLQSNTAITTSPTGTIVVSAIAESPQAAADLTNAYLEELDRVNRALAQREASGIREFIEAELDDARVRLTDAEERMRTFQEQYGAIEITEQARAVIAGAATLSAQILGAEVELRVLRRTRDATHPDVVQP
jgi:capsule polysaccharide export protein KpsE/RkpR